MRELLALLPAGLFGPRSRGDRNADREEQFELGARTTKEAEVHLDDLCRAICTSKLARSFQRREI